MEDRVEAFSFSPIGYVHGGGTYRCQAPRQGVFAANSGFIELAARRNFETALADLQGFSRIWVVFVFDRISGWRPKVRPPVAGGGRRIGVFATRSPHRPNPIGISAVELDGIDGRRLYIRNFDLLDGTPVLDIKPYIPDADAFPDAATGWRQEAAAVARELVFSGLAREAVDWLKHFDIDLDAVCRSQLATVELDRTRQRLEASPHHADGWILAWRTWRIVFHRESAANRMVIEDIRSGYTEHELEPGAPDPYNDKAIHREFLKREFT